MATWYVEQVTTFKLIPDGIGFQNPGGFATPQGGGNTTLGHVPSLGRVVQVINTEPVPGGASPSQANFNTAIANLGTDAQASVAANLATLQAIGTGAVS